MSRQLQIPQYSAGTIAIANVAGVWTATGTGTVWTSPDGVAQWTIAVGDILVVPGSNAFGIVASIASNTSLTLAYWSGSAVSAGASYAINRLTGLPSTAAAGLAQNLLQLGSTANPFAALSALVGSGKINFTTDGSGNILLQVRTAGTGVTDSAYVTALTINPTTGAVTLAIGAGSITAAAITAALGYPPASKPTGVLLSASSTLPATETGSVATLTGSATFTTTLWTTAGNGGTSITLANISSAAQTVAAASGQLFYGDGVSGVATFSIPVATIVTFITDGSNWIVESVSSTNGSPLTTAGGTISGNLAITGSALVGGNAILTAASIATSSAAGIVKPDVTATISPTTGLLSDALSFRNRVDNGEFMVAQRGASLSTPANGAYTLDRWQVWWAGAAPASVAQVAGPTGYKSAMQITGATGNTALSLSHKISAFNTADLVGQNVTLSFTASASVAQTLSFSLSYAGAYDNFGTTTLIGNSTAALTTSPTRFSYTFSNLPVGAAYGLFLGLVLQNGGAFTSGAVSITGIQLELGSQATPYEHRPISLETAICQRYFIYSGFSYGTQFYADVSGRYQAAIYSFKVQMRATPTVVAAWSGGVNVTANAFVASTTDVVTSVSANSAGGCSATLTWTSFSAEL
jgi:hypothetical protein